MIPEKETVYTREGTLAHAVAEYLLHYYYDNAVTPTDDIWFKQLSWDDPQWLGLSRQAKDDGFDFQEIVTTVHDFYVLVVLEDFFTSKAQFPDTVLLIEAPLKLDAFIPEGFGSSDAVLIYNNTLQVYDLKYGKGVRVMAKDNSQMRCYALGALCGPGETYDIRTVIMTIVQPRLQHLSSDAMTADQLYQWGLEDLQPAAWRAWDGDGEPTPGDHCKFCKAAPQCQALRRMAEQTVSDSGRFTLLSPEELSDCLSKLPVIKDWVAALEEYALDSTLNGREIPGWKVVEGRSVRKISDPQTAVAVLTKAGFTPEEYFRPAELKTISDLERLVGKRNFPTLLGACVTKPQGKPTLAPISDPRPEFSFAEADFADSLN